MRKLRYAMVGGGRDAFIGGVHRKAMALDGQMELVAGALSSSPEKALASGRDLGLANDRNHGAWQELLDDELRPPAERIDFVSIVTPNHMHYPVARPLPRPASTSSATSRWCTPASRRKTCCSCRRRASSLPSPTTTPAIRWCARRGRWSAAEPLAKSAR